MILSIAQQILRARKHGFTDAEMPDLCAVIMTESGGDTRAVQPRGKGRGLVQIDLGEHPDVTEAEAFDPDFALEFARRLSRNPHGFGAPNWYGPGDHPQDAAKARAAARAVLAKETPMDLWHPRAQRVIPADGHTGLSFDDVPWKIVLHTTETDTYWPSRTSYYGNPYWPHATIVPGTIYQHLPIDVGGYALYSDGTVATNHANAVQCEIVWRAANADWPDELLETVADWVSWVQAQTGVPTEIAEMWRPGVVVASVDSPIRFGDQEWLDFTGICGHSNVPGGNDHWDPGRLPVESLRALLDPTPQEDPDMSHVSIRPGERQLIGVPIVDGGGGAKWTSVTIGAPAPGAIIDIAWAWPSERRIPGVHQAKSFAGLVGFDMAPGEQAVEVWNRSPTVIVTVEIESGK